MMTFYLSCKRSLSSVLFHALILQLRFKGRKERREEGRQRGGREGERKEGREEGRKEEERKRSRRRKELVPCYRKVILEIELSSLTSHPVLKHRNFVLAGVVGLLHFMSLYRSSVKSLMLASECNN